MDRKFGRIALKLGLSVGAVFIGTLGALLLGKSLFGLSHLSPTLNLLFITCLLIAVWVKGPLQRRGTGALVGIAIGIVAYALPDIISVRSDSIASKIMGINSVLGITLAIGTTFMMSKE